MRPCILFIGWWVVLLGCGRGLNQTKTDPTTGTGLPAPVASEPVPRKEGAPGQARIIKTQGADKYSQVRCGLQDVAGHIWVGTTGEGVFRYDGTSFTQLTTRDGLPSNIVWCMLQDTQGGLWFGTQRGLCRYNGRAFEAVAIAVEGDAPVSQSSVNALLQDQSRTLWVCAQDGVYCFDGKAFKRFLPDPLVADPDGVSLRGVGYILEDKGGTLWFGSGSFEAGEGLCRYDGKFITSYKPNGDGWIRYMVEARDGSIWFGTRHNGNWRYDGKDYAKTENAGRAVGAPVLVDRARRMWFRGEEHDNGFGGTDGVWCYDGKAYRNFTAKDGMGDYGVWCIFEDLKGGIWFGTRNVGLYRYDGVGFTSFSE